MSRGYQQYSGYKMSDVEWVGEAPAGWGVKPFFVHASQCKRSNKGMVNDNLLSLSFGRVVRKNIETSEGLLPASFETYQVVEPNDVVFRLTDLQNDKRSLRSAICPESGIITSAYLATQPMGMDPSYFAYLMRSYDLTKVFYALGSGLRQSLKYSDMKRLPLLVPSCEEQTQIAKFLDYETVKIDTLIEKQQQLIALLKEKRQAVISHAVTKGLNPDAPMRDSGVEWLGEVPAHWEVRTLKQLISTRKGAAFKSADFIDDGLEVVRASDIKNLGIKRSGVFLPASFVASYPRAVLRTGDLVLSTVGSGPDVKNSAVGQIGRVPQILNGTLLNQNTVVFRVVESCMSDHFLFYLVQLNGYRDHLDLHAHGTANQASLNVVDMLNFIVPMPPDTEQRKIVEFLSKTAVKMSELEESAAHLVDLLQERRTALISAAVTGKIDVRNWQAPESENETEAA